MQGKHWKTAAALGLPGLIAALWAFWPKGPAPIPGVTYEAQYIVPGPMLHLADVLASDALEGRGAGSPGNEAGRGFIRKRFEDMGLTPFLASGWEQAVPVLPRDGLGTPVPGANLIGWVPGNTPGVGPVIVVTAHHDHLGIRNGEIYNGADDNASGTAMLTALAEYFIHAPPTHDIIFVALDAEEVGFQGARAFIRDGAIPMDRVALNINLDMVSRSEAGELYAAGTYHTPLLAALVEEVAATAPVKLLMGHDRPEDGPNDWTNQSDHAVFHQLGIPFLYFGVEDHPGYHQPTDDFSAITPDFYVRAGDTVAQVITAADRQLGDIAPLRAPAPASETTTPSTEETPE
jgi:Zn-dependent M28 family amino/carboxypeptidase